MLETSGQIKIVYQSVSSKSGYYGEAKGGAGRLKQLMKQLNSLLSQKFPGSRSSNSSSAYKSVKLCANMCLVRAITFWAIDTA